MNKKDAGRLGGIAVREKYGRNHFSRIGKLGAIAMHKKYAIEPYGLSYYALIERETYKIKAIF